MAAEAVDEKRYLIKMDAVRACISELRSQRIHPFFPAYLHLRQQAARQGRLADVAPNWNALGTLLEVPGGPLGRPYFRPFWAGPATAGQEWLNPNLAGSYAPSSIRQLPRKVIDISPDGKFSLRENHWELARRHLTDEKPVPLLALAGFFFRDFAFLSENTPKPADLMQVFLNEFGYRSPADDVEVDHLYDRVWSAHDDNPWFAAVEEAAAE